MASIRVLITQQLACLYHYRGTLPSGAAERTRHPPQCFYKSKLYLVFASYALPCIYWNAHHPPVSTELLNQGPARYPIGVTQFYSFTPTKAVGLVVGVVLPIIYTVSVGVLGEVWSSSCEDASKQIACYRTSVVHGTRLIVFFREATTTPAVRRTYVYTSYRSARERTISRSNGYRRKA